MSDASSVDAILNQAKERETAYDWLRAIELYKTALNSVPATNFLRIGQVQERMGYAFYRAALQAESVNQFKERMPEAAACYEKAKEFCSKLSEPGKKPWMLRCDAVIAYISYWLAIEPPEKMRLLNECWRLTKEALKAFKEVGESLEYGKTYNQLSSSAFGKFSLDWDFEASEKTLSEAVEYGEQAINLLSRLGDASELAKAYVKTAICLSTFGYAFIRDMDEKERYYQRSRGYWKKANELCQETAFLEFLNVSGATSEEAWGFEEIRVQYENALGRVKKTKDKNLIGNALDWLAYASFWTSIGIEDPDKRIETLRKALQYAEDAKDNFSLISFTSPRGAALWTGAPQTEYYWQLALWETDLKKRRDLLEKAIMNEASMMELAESTRYQEIMAYAHHALSKALGSLAQIETNPEEKRRLLTKALEHRNEDVRLAEQFQRFRYWDRGVVRNYLADLKAELSNFENDPEKKQKMLEEAVSDKERCLQLCLKEMPYYEKVGSLSYYAALGGYQHSYGGLLNRLYGLTGNSEHQRKAIKAFEDVAESFGKLDMSSRVAECHWEIARGFEALGNFPKAAESFVSAAKSYTRAAEKIPQLKDFYQDHALYMQAWSEIERARHHHLRQGYESARQHYEKAANLHKSSKQWSYLTSNYSAWAEVENAEALSRNEQSEEAIRAFHNAVELFLETKKSLQAGLSEIENADEKQMVTNLLKATDLRREYCTARIALEEARILDKKGDHYSSSEKYGSAAENFEKLSQALESDQEQRELKFITSLSRGWQKMTRAEAEASPALYHEASQLFEEAKEFGSSERIKMLTLGHSRFCRALEAGTRFTDTRDATSHDAVMQHLGSAADYYVKAGFQNASEYTQATKLLFDAYVHIGNAERETDPEKKARLYAMAEKILQTSAGSFMKAEHPEKREQVLMLLEKVKEERELALSLSEVLHAPTIISATTAFSTPNPTHESAVGLERFEHADIQANLITRQKELKVGESLNLEVELINAGKGAALLIKLTQVVPEGFEITEKPEIYRVEDSYLNMKGKRLDPLKTEDIKLVLKPKAQGTFPLKPRILYLDEDGKYKSHELEPITIIVKELGIKGWIKGER